MTKSSALPKGYALEELLKSYFWKAGYFAVRGVPYLVGDDTISDIDLWLYERPAASTRRRVIVDIKNKKSPKAGERIIWTKGLQMALSVDTAIVATTDKRAATRLLAKDVGIALLDGEAISKLESHDHLIDEGQVSFEEIADEVKLIDVNRRSSEWREAFLLARASLLIGFGVQSTNKNLAINSFFSEQAVLAQPNTSQASMCVRLAYFSASLAAISLDYVLADHAFKSPDERRQIIIDALRFGESEKSSSVSTIKAAIGLARQYADNGPAVAKQIEHGVYADADRIPAEIIADYAAKYAVRDVLFNVARELNFSSFSRALVPFDALTSEAKAFLGVVLDFNGISREKFSNSYNSVKKRSPEKKEMNTGEQAALFGDTRKS